MNDETENPPLILVVEDESKMRRFIVTLLEGHQYRVIEAEDAEQALMMAATHSPDVILLDLGLPDIDGLEVTQRVREWTTTPIIVLSARGLESDKVDALDAGADDYLTKPFGARELLARIRVATRHLALRSQDEPTVEIGTLRIDLARRMVWVDEERVALTATEYKLLHILAANAGKILTHREILKEVWGPGSTAQTHYVRVYMAHLRKKIERDPAQPEYILTETGIGYRLRAE